MSTRQPYFPLYLVLFESEQTSSEAYEPILRLPGDQPGETTHPHGLMRDMIPALPALSYLLHLPRWEGDLEDMAARLLRAQMDYEIPHRYLIMPYPMILEPAVAPALDHIAPALIFAPRGIATEAEKLGRRLNSPLPVAIIESLGPSTVKQHWQALSDVIGAKGLVTPVPLLARDFATDGMRLPNQFLVRQFGKDPKEAEKGDPSLAFLALQHHMATLARLDEEQVSAEERSRRYKDVSDGEQLRFRYPLVITAMGVPRGYRTKMTGNGWTTVGTTADDPAGASAPPPNDGDVEDVASMVLAVHRALAKSGAVVKLPPIPDRCFDLLAELEDYCRAGAPESRKIWRMVRRIGSTVASLFDENAWRLIRHASSITAFSGFPIGLAMPDGLSAPLSCGVPIAYRPLLPLTRAIQQEGFQRDAVFLGDGFRILIAECIDPTEDATIHKLAESGWGFAREALADLAKTTCDTVQIHTVADLNAALSDEAYDVLILSAHGFYDRESNGAGVVIGGERVMGPELGRMPPLVLLSSCHVCPRGRGVVSIADMLLRQGALAVVGTLIPVDVRHNATLIVRLMTYVREVTKEGRADMRSFADVFKHVLVSNAVNDVLAMSAATREWTIKARYSGRNVVEEFMLHRAPGRLRTAHIYRDTEEVLQEIANDTGFGEVFRSTLRSQSYLPESLFYIVLGWPDRILFRDDLVARYRSNQQAEDDCASPSAQSSAPPRDRREPR